MKLSFLATLALFTTISSFSQKEFFRSKQIFSTSQLGNFYSSVTIDGDLMLFIANDYTLYAYDKTSGEQKWTTPIGYKTKTQCFITNGVVYAPYYSDKQEITATFDAVTGKFIKELTFGPLQTKPVIKDGVLYGTAIYEAGCLFAYDTKTDSVLWWKFIAHGLSTQPYFFDKYILANAEANNWFKINYKGQLTDTTCKEKADMFVQDIPCIKKFGALTHDGLELDEAFSTKIFDNDEEAISTENTLVTAKHSFVLREDKLAIIGNKRKLTKLVDLSELVEDSVHEYNLGLNQLLAANDETVTFVYLNQLMVYNFKQGKVEKQLDLSSFDPYQLLLDKDKFWLISRNDGLLYGFTY
jgi:PQQ-like domain